jgi:hypothetical protein
MPRNQMTRDDMKIWLLSCKNKLQEERKYHSYDAVELANRYLNMVLDKIEEYRY